MVESRSFEVFTGPRGKSPHAAERRSVIRRSLLNARTLEKQDIPQVAQWNVQLHEDEASPPMSVDAATKRLRRWFEDGTFQGAIFLADGKSVGYVLYEHRPVHADHMTGAVRHLFRAIWPLKATPLLRWDHWVKSGAGPKSKQRVLPLPPASSTC